jgi:uroporphyrinogen III methyltransferase / synthase
LPDAIASPLAGKRIAITRSPDQAEAFCRELTARGAIPVLVPTISFAPPSDLGPLDRCLGQLAAFDWLLLTSQNAISALADRCRELGFDLADVVSSPTASGKDRRPEVAAVGPATAEAAARAGLRVAFVAQEHRGAALAAELGPRLRGARILLPRSDRGSAALPDALRGLGASVTDVVAYRTIRAETGGESLLGQLRAGRVDVITFFSPSALHILTEEVGLDTLRALHPHAAFAAIGPVTASALSDAGLPPEIIAADASVSALVAALSDYFALNHRTGGRSE